MHSDLFYCWFLSTSSSCYIWPKVTLWTKNLSAHNNIQQEPAARHTFHQSQHTHKSSGNLATAGARLHRFNDSIPLVYLLTLRCFQISLCYFRVQNLLDLTLLLSWKSCCFHLPFIPLFSDKRYGGVKMLTISRNYCVGREWSLKEKADFSTIRYLSDLPLKTAHWL